jgi:hypothetical protein
MQFKYHCIEKFNERWNEFSNDINLLAFFLHPKYHGKIIMLFQIFKILNFNSFFDFR